MTNAEWIPPSREGEWETGCHGADANELALIALTWGEFVDERRRLRAAWGEFLRGYQRETLCTSKAELEAVSLGWLLQRAAGLYRRVCEACAASCPEETDPEYPDIPAREERFAQLSERDKPTIRDWFCWLHRDFLADNAEDALRIKMQHD